MLARSLTHLSHGVCTLVALALLPCSASALTLGDLDAGATITSLDGSIRYSNFSIAPSSGGIIVPFVDVPVFATDTGFTLGATGCYATVVMTDCLFNHFDGPGYGPGLVDDLLLSFTMEALVGDIVGVGLSGSSEIYMVDEADGQRLFSLHDTETIASLDVGLDRLVHERICAEESCGDLSDFDLASQFAGVTTLDSELFVRTLSSELMTDAGACSDLGCFGSSAALGPLAISAEIDAAVPEPSSGTLFLIGALVFGSHRRSRRAPPSS